MLHLGMQLGFQIQGAYSEATSILDLHEGFFVSEIPSHPYYLSDELAMVASQLNTISLYSELENIKLNRTTRRKLLDAFGQYLSLHITDFGILKTLTVLQEILS
jgi:DNA repair protein RecO (recombination protein O)